MKVPRGTTGRKDRLIVVGGGPVGLYAAFYAGLRGLQPIVIESAPYIGGQIASYYPEQPIYDMPGGPTIGQEVVRQLSHQAQLADTQFMLGQTMSDGSIGADSVCIHLADGGMVTGDAAIITTGSGRTSLRHLSPPIPPPNAPRIISQLDNFEELRAKKVVVVGGTQRSLRLAKMIRAFGEVKLIWPESSTIAPTDFAAAGITVVLMENYSMVSGGVVVCHNGRESRLSADVLIVGSSVQTGPASLPFLTDVWTTDGLPVDSSMAVIGRQRLFAAGDCTHYDGKLRLLANGFGEAATAVNHIANMLDPCQKVFPGHSTSRAPRWLTGLVGGLPGEPSV